MSVILSKAWLIVMVDGAGSLIRIKRPDLRCVDAAIKMSVDGLEVTLAPDRLWSRSMR